MKAILKRAVVSLGLSVFFLVVYGGCEQVAALRALVPSFYFSWERRVPFIAAAIVPYLSLDLFFITAPLLIRSDRQLRTFAMRVLVAIAVAAVFFLCLPLKFAFVRPPVPGRIGFVFAQFQRADLPFNQLPSLHIALLLIVGDVFIRGAHGWMRAALLTWFLIIGASPLLVYQHHVVDLVAGLALGLVCMNFIRDGIEPVPFERNRRIGLYYAVAAIVTTYGCVCLGRASWPLWWPALSLMGVAAGYWFVGPPLYAKREGRLDWTSLLLFWPTLLGQHASLRWYARSCRPYDRVTETLWIGRQLSNRQAAAVRQAGVGVVIDLTCEFTEPAAFRSLHYLNLPTLDLTAPTQEQIALALAFARKHQEASMVYVHCKAGYSRSAVIAAAYLLANGRAHSVDEAIDLLRDARPSMIVRPEARRAIELFHIGGWRVAPEKAISYSPNYSEI